MKILLLVVVYLVVVVVVVGDGAVENIDADESEDAVDAEVDGVDDVECYTLVVVVDDEDGAVDEGKKTRK